MTDESMVEVGEEPMAPGERRRFYILSGVFILVAALLTTGIIYFTSDRGDKTINSTISLTAEDKAEGERVTKEFLRLAGTWGLRENTVNEENLKTVLFTVQQNTQTADTYWLSRNASYLNLRKDYVAPNSYLWFNEDVVQRWWDAISRESLASFETLTVEPTIPAKASKLTVGDMETFAMTIPVKYTVRERKYVPTATDAEWDGTFIVSKRVYEENAQLILIKSGDGWRAYQLTGNKYPFLLSTWNTPDNDYNAEQFGFEEESRIKAKIGTP